MKVSKEKPENPDMGVIVDQESADCFTKDWAANDEHCDMCGMANVCMVLTTKKVKAKGDAFNILAGTFVDEIDFSNIPIDGVLAHIQRTPTSIQELRTVWSQLSGCVDDITIAIHVNRFILTNKLKIENGYVSM